VLDYGSSEPVLQCVNQNRQVVSNRFVKEPGAVKRELQVFQTVAGLSTQMMWNVVRALLACVPGQRTSDAFAPSRTAPYVKSTGRSSNRLSRNPGSRECSPWCERKSKCSPASCAMSTLHTRHPSIARANLVRHAPAVPCRA